MSSTHTLAPSQYPDRALLIVIGYLSTAHPIPPYHSAISEQLLLYQWHSATRPGSFQLETCLVIY
eukprot:3941332-Rhodomonas_salina.3